jgi:hypothetical protein
VFTYREPRMIDLELASRWAAAGPLSPRALQWSWFRVAAPLALQRGADALALQARVEPELLAGAFFAWAGALEPNARFEDLDAADHGHYCCGMLLRFLLPARAVSCAGALPEAPSDPRLAAWLAWPEAALQARLVFTLLDAWRRGLGAAPLALDSAAVTPANIASCFENVREDPTQAIGFLDLFTGRQPVWRFPMLEGERPAMQAALAARR